MNRIYLIVVVACLLLALATAPMASEERGWGLDVDDDGNVYMTCTVNDTRVVTVKYDPNGEIVWERTFSLGAFASAIEIDPYGDIVVMDDGAFGFVKYDPEGTEISSGGFYSIDRLWGESICIDSGGNIYVAGMADVNEYFTRGDYLLVKYDGDGNVQWHQTASGPNKYNLPLDLSIGGSDGIYMTGKGCYDYPCRGLTVKFASDGEVVWKESIPDIDPYKSCLYSVVADDAGNVYDAGVYIDMAIIRKIGVDGTKEWEDTIRGGYPTTSFSDVIVDIDGGVIICGDSVDNLIQDRGEILVARYDAEGNQTWLSTYNQEGEDFYDGAMQVANDYLGNIYVSARTRKGIESSADYVLLKYNADGDLLWAQTYDENGYEDLIRGLVIDNSNYIYVTGTSCLGSDYTLCDALTIKYDSDGNIVWKARYDYSDTHGDDDDDDDSADDDDDDDDDDSGCCG
ncbi:MAG: hypothetical protein P9M14_14550 [Candidatus Alcyoniella australis]|nr:hypothetical protein [Candidatus Alcyoniella australis]